ncbi:MAG: hypothetical protein NZ866_01485, partial [Patescibacteria group bacterium]|nr:hypothetical protein [Patescibacteria group bacterium]
NYRFNVIATDVNNSNNREERNVNFRVQRRTDIPQLNLNIISPQNNSQLYTGTINLIASTSRRSNIRFSLNKIGTSIYLFPPECNNVDYCSRTVNISEEGRYRLIVRAFDSQFPEIREERSIEFEARRREESRPELNLRILFPIDASQYLEGNNITFSAQTSRLANFSAQIINSDNNTNFDTFTCNNTISCSRQYNNLPPANYRFNVIATDVNNSNNREERNVNFRVMARQQEQPSISLIISWPPQNYITYIAPDRSEASLNFRAETNIVANFNMEVINNSNNNIITSFSCSSTTRCDRYNINLPEGDYQLRVRATDINRQDNSVTLSHTFRVVRMRETDNSNLRPTNFNVRFEERNNRGFPVFRFTWETPTGITSLNPLVEYRLYYCTNNPDCRPTSFRSAYGVFRGSYPTSWLIDINSNNNYFKFVLMAIYNNGEFAYSNTAEINLSSGGNLNIQDNMLANFLLLLMMLLNDRNR